MKDSRKKTKNKINNSMPKAKKTDKVNESKEIVSFLKSISQKNYSEANKYLQSIIDSKIKGRIGEALKQKFF